MSNAQLDIKGIVVPCSSCGQKNRLQYTQLGRESRCGKCQTAIIVPGEAIEASDSSSFQALVANSTLPILVDFWAEWCGPCKMAAPEVAKAAVTGAGKVLTVKVNTETLPDISQRYGINSIPTFILFANGAEKNRIQGARSAADLLRFAGV